MENRQGTVWEKPQSDAFCNGIKAGKLVYFPRSKEDRGGDERRHSKSDPEFPDNKGTGWDKNDNCHNDQNGGKIDVVGIGKVLGEAKKRGGLEKKKQEQENGGELRVGNGKVSSSKAPGNRHR